MHQSKYSSLEDDTSLQGSRLTPLKVNVHPCRMHNLGCFCSTPVYFCPPVSYVVQTCLQSVALSHSFWCLLHTPVFCLENLNSQTMPSQRNGLKFCISTTFCLLLLFISRLLPSLTAAICKAHDSSNSEYKLILKIAFHFSSDIRQQESDNILQ